MTYNPEEIINSVEIVEPPIQEFHKRGRWFATACFSGCGCVVLFIATIIIGIKMFIGAGPRQIKNLPDNFPKAISIYDQYNVSKITIISGKYKSRSMDLSTLFPKIILSPLIYSDQKSGQNDNPGVVKELWQILTKPTSDSRDMIQIEWRNIAGNSEDIIDYYRAKLAEGNFQVDSESTGQNYRQFTFRRADGLSGTVYVQNSQQKNNIPYAFIMINLPPPPAPEQATSTPPADVSTTIEDASI
jgi:hypothetical protein